MFHTPTTMFGMTRKLFLNGTPQQQPWAVITVGPAGSGKSYSLYNPEGCLAYLETNVNGPKPESFVEIDPDSWIGQLCDNDNQYRPLCNYLNLATFFCSMNQRNNIIFGGTG